MAGQTLAAVQAGPVLATVKSCPGLARGAPCFPARDRAGAVTAQAAGSGPCGLAISPGHLSILAQPIRELSLCPERLFERHSHPHPSMGPGAEPRPL